MYFGLIALLTRALRLDARQLRNHVFRLAFVGFIYLSMLWATIWSSMFGAPGLQFFEHIVWLNVLFISCAGVGYFSSAITEEKEEETIGLLQMAGLNHLGILLGKSTSRLIQVILLLIVQFPFMLLAVTLGGVTTQQIIAAYVDLMAYTVLLANTGLVCSVVFQRGGNAAAVTTVLMVMHSVSPVVATAELTFLKASGWTKTNGWMSAILNSLEWIEESSVLKELTKVTTTGFNEPVFTKQVLSNIGVGIFFFGLAWLLFGPSVNNAAPGGTTRGGVVKSTSRMKFLSPGRCWVNPFVWKDFQFIGGGYLLFVVKLIAYLGLFAGIGGISNIYGSVLGFDFTRVGEIFFGCMLFAFVVESCISASRVFHDEIRMQTMSSLLMLPRSIPYVGYSKAIGCMLGLTPALLCLGLAVMQLNVTPEAVLRSLIEPAFWGVIMAFLVFLHLIALLSLFVKWGALPLAFFLMGPLSGCCPVAFAVASFGQRQAVDSWGNLPATITIWILTGLVCFVFQMMIAARLQELGTR